MLADALSIALEAKNEWENLRIQEESAWHELAWKESELQVKFNVYFY